MSLKSTFRHDYALYRVEPGAPNRHAPEPLFTVPLWVFPAVLGVVGLVCFIAGAILL